MGLSRYAQYKGPAPETNPFNVKPGQIWEDCDRRHVGRRLKVLKLQGTHALCEVVVTTDRVLIRLERFKPNATGHRLVEEAP